MPNNTPINFRRKLYWRTGWLCVIVIVMILWLFPSYLLPPMALWLDAVDQPRKTDYIMIMPGGEETRPFAAAVMVRRKLASIVLVPRTVDSPVVEDGILPANHEIIRRVLNLRGVPDEKIVFLNSQSASSWNDAQALGTFLVDKPRATVAIVTNDYHCRRTRWVFNKLLGEKISEIFFVSAPSDDFSAEDWWRYEAGLKTYLAEYIKLVVYWLRYGSAWIWFVVISMTMVLWKLVPRMLPPTPVSCLSDGIRNSTAVRD